MFGQAFGNLSAAGLQFMYLCVFFITYYVFIVNSFNTYCVFIIYLTKYFANVLYLFIIYYVLFHVAPVVILSFLFSLCLFLFCKY